ncbi:sulfate ABC transporter substrate-binding protein [Fischerella thermalis]|uniref:sulfate ABC transporter substrate-binding protein n=1 Tax=Fischerella thermalis TaxID=372787 RepID=UPI001A0A0BF0|nr:sulfate ABC transporter substrate-binding protein [Fischerella thermalis]MBF1989696.1 sulfate ABC transporter substrate-binding protein [Fischerella thermalis M58_A2018_009]MBF2060181.1 sulfate ABC transporter substrate-binding protein [Fischerella thermalis M66_A2018_004]MBF2069412.1 sulfate ABC transporter substrate-binding protein [Fischerella thermalis M48_A2018_028]
MSSWQRVITKSRQTLLKITSKVRVNSIKGFLSLALVGVSLSVAIASCSGGNGNGTADAPTANPVAAGNNKQDVEITLVSFAVTRAAYDTILPKFVEKWKQEHNQNVTFNRSYGGSGSQTRAVIDGLEADIVHLALALDTQKIEKAGLIEPGWEKELPNNAVVSRSVAALITRPGNPKNIKTWADLEKGDIKVITADPKTSGIARWNFLALWNSVIKTGGGEDKALDYVTKVYSNVPILTKDAREATDAFAKQGQGDVLINYENEAILAQQKGEKVDYVVPDVNISIDNPIAVVDKNVDKHGTREVAEAFVQYLFTPEAQLEFAKLGFRPLDEAVAQNKELKALADKYTKVNNLGNVQDYGGWAEVQTKFFEDGAVFDQIQGKIRR